MKFSTLLSLASAALLLTACQNEVEELTSVFAPDEIPILAQEFNEDFFEVPAYTAVENLPLHFSLFGSGSASKSEDKLVHLGRALFYDTRLSADLSISCASCHDQAKAFADDKAVSTGIQGRSTARNAQSINNIVAYYGNTGSGFFRDRRATSLERQVEESMGNPDEMGMSLEDVVERLRLTETYPILFDRLANDTRLQKETVTRALAAFTRNISSTSSKFDRALDLKLRAEGEVEQGFGLVDVKSDFTYGSIAEQFTADENAGKTIYLQHCQSCHSNQVPQRLEARNNGLYAEGGYEDKGVGGLASSEVAFNGLFKTPQLRNVALTAPYMHNGSIQTLEEVIEHYSANIADRTNLSEELKRLPMQTSGRRGFGFSEEEKRQLLAFLHTLSDTELMSRQEFSSPLKS